MFAALVCAADAQTYQVGSDVSKDGRTPARQGAAPNPLGWGSNIQNARLARAAELALQHGNRAQAFDYAQRAVQAAPNDAQLWFLLGYAARLDGKLQVSLDAYNRGLRLTPTAVEGVSGIAQDYCVMGRYQDAERLLKEVVASHPERTDDTVLLGELHVKSRDFGSAVDLLTRAEGRRPDQRAELLLAISYQQLKQMDLSRHYLQLVESRAPNDPDVERSMAGYYREMGKYSEAIAELKKIRSAKPDLIAELAYTYQLEGEPDKSARLYAEAADAAPGDLNLQLAAAQAQIATGATAKAEMLLSRVSGFNQNQYQLHALRGQIAEMEDRDGDAVRELNLALANLPVDPAEGALYGIQLHMDLVGLYRRLGNADASQRQLDIARDAIGTVEAAGPEQGQFLRLRAEIKMNAGDPDGALGDIQEAIKANSGDRANMQIYGDILARLGRTDEATTAFKRVLAKDPDNRFALTSLGYVSRAAGQEKDAEKYFVRLSQVEPSSYAPWLALGDLYTSVREFPKAQASYSKGHDLVPDNALIVAGGINAGIEAHNLGLAGLWFNRVTPEMQTEPQVLREKERYLSFEGKYQESAEVGKQAIKVLPKDRDVVVYLGYDLLHLGQFDELLELTKRYFDVLPQEPDIPLLAGYVHKHYGLNEFARQDFTEVLRRDPEVVTGYVNRGFMANDLHEPQAAAEDFESALKREPDDGEAHLGLAYANLDLQKPQAALQQVELAERSMSDSRDFHMIRATAYGRQEMLSKAATEYKAALRFTPDDGALHLALGNVLLSERKFHDAVNELEVAGRFSPNNVIVHALLARSYANLGDRDQTLRNVELAEQHVQSEKPAGQSQVFLSTGEALNTLGERDEAMDRFRRALEIPSGDRVGVRLAVAQLMADQAQADDAQRQIALAMMEAAAGDAAPPSGSEYVTAADVFRSTHDYQLSQNYLQRAKVAGASDRDVRLGLANNYLALGDTPRAKAELNAIRAEAGDAPDFQFLLAQANVYRQEHRGAQALTTFAQATNAEGQDETVEQSMLQAGADEGMRVTPKISVLSDFSVEPIFEDTTVYVLDSKLDTAFPAPSTNTSLLPPPRSSLQTEWTDAFHVHLGNLPTAGGFFQMRNARGQISVPSTNSIVNRHTTDYSFNIGMSPTVRLGNNVVAFDGGIQETLRRDSLSPVQMNQNLFRLYAYVSTSSFFNVLSLNGYYIREAGPFTERRIRSTGYTGALDFRVGAPWGKTALVTGWGATNQFFSPIRYQNYYTSSYIGLERRFTEHLNARAVIADLRSWRIVGNNSAIAQALRPAGTVDFMPKRNWDLQFSTAYSSTRGFHVYDAVQNSFSVSYAMPFRRKFNDDSGPLILQYPIRFSAGVQQESFFNFAGAQNQQFRPYLEISIF